MINFSNKPITIHLYDGGSWNITKLKQINQGGEGTIFTSPEHDGFVFKAITRQGYLQRIRALRQRTEKWIDVYDERPPNSFEYRGIPLGQGSCLAETLNLTPLNGKYEDENKHKTRIAYIFVYRYLDPAQELHQRFNITKKQFENIKTQTITEQKLRYKLALEIAETLYCLETMGIIHGDLYPNNFMVQNENVFILDTEGAGIRRIPHCDLPPRKPTALQNDASYIPFSPNMFPPPDSLEKEHLLAAQYKNRWSGLSLIWQVLTGTHNPLVFIKDISLFSQAKMLNFWNNLDDTQSEQWPPQLKDSQRYEDIFKCKIASSEFESFMEHFFGRDSDFSKILFKTFVMGAFDPKSCASFSDIYETLKNLDHE